MFYDSSGLNIGNCGWRTKAVILKSEVPDSSRCFVMTAAGLSFEVSTEAQSSRKFDELCYS